MHVYSFINNITMYIYSNPIRDPIFTPNIMDTSNILWRLNIYI